MGGTGSGRGGGRPTIEKCGSYSLTLKRLSRPLAECFRAAGRFSVTYTWHDGFEAKLEFDFSVPAYPSLRLTHETNRLDDNEETRYCVSLQWTRPPYGGRRWWFTCPRSWRRCGKLYLPMGGTRFLSRHGYGLRYQSQRETPVDRAWRKKRKIARQLGGPADDYSGDLPDKPKWMRWRTYDSLADSWQAAEDALDAGTFATLQRLMNRART